MIYFFDDTSIHSAAGLRRVPGQVEKLVDAGEGWLLLYTASPMRHDQIRATERATVCAARFPKRRFLGLHSIHWQ